MSNQIEEKKQLHFLILTPLMTVGAISSDLYRPQSQDDIVEFSFFVALSYEYNLQLVVFDEKYQCQA